VGEKRHTLLLKQLEVFRQPLVPARRLSVSPQLLREVSVFLGGHGIAVIGAQQDEKRQESDGHAGAGKRPH